MKQILVLIVKCDLSGLADPPYSTVAITQVSCANFESHGTPHIVCPPELCVMEYCKWRDQEQWWTCTLWIRFQMTFMLHYPISLHSQNASSKTIIRNLKRQQHNIKASWIPWGHGTLLWLLKSHTLKLALTGCVYYFYLGKMRGPVHVWAHISHTLS